MFLLLDSALAQFRQADLQDMSDLLGGIHRDVDPVAFEQAHVRPVEVARSAMLSWKAESR